MANVLTFLPPSAAQALAGTPPWLVITAGVFALLAGIWVLGKLLKWTLYLALIALLAGIVAVGVWMLLNALHLVPPAPRP